MYYHITDNITTVSVRGKKQNLTTAQVTIIFMG